MVQNKKKAAVMCSQGLGDGVIFSLVAHHLFLEGYEVTTFSPPLQGLQSWFPFQKIVPYLSAQEWEAALNAYDLVVIQPGALPFPKFQNFPIELPPQVYFLHNHLHDPSQTLVANLVHTLKGRFNIPSAIPKNGIAPPSHLIHRKYPKRIAIHPTSGEAFRSWPLKRFMKVASDLTNQGYEPVFVMSAKERAAFRAPAPLFQSLDAAASFIYESGFFIGNDSGLGHLASSLGIPTVTLFHKKAISQFWSPGFALSRSVLPLPVIPKEKWKAKFWKYLLFPFQVVRQFRSLEKEFNENG